MAHPTASSGFARPEAALPRRADIVIVGGGMAGLSTAWQLAELGVANVVLLEAEPLLASHASARNAAIFLPLEESLSAVWLASRSRDLIDARLGTSWLAAQGVALVSAERDPLDALKFAARQFGVYHHSWSARELARELTDLQGGVCREALFLPLGGVMDVHMVLTRIQAWLRASGVRVITGERVEEVRVERGRVCGVQLSDGRALDTERVVLAGGAFSGALGARAGSRLTLTPMRRHLVQLCGAGMPAPRSPVVWRLDEPVYYRPEAGGVLASPCDEVPFEPCIPPSDPGVLSTLYEKLGRLAPALAEHAGVRRSWACLRTVTEDRELAVGADGRVKGLFWCAGLGGRGMTCGVAAGELMARTLVGLAHPLTRSLTPERFA